MPRIVLTDSVLKSLKPQRRQVQYWDASLPSFACRVNPAGTKTFNVMIGEQRRLIRIGHYPAISLAAARKRAHELMEEHDPSIISFSNARDLFFTSHLDTLKASTAYEQKLIMRRFSFTKPLAAITAKDVSDVLDTMPRGSARSAFNVFRTFLNWSIEAGYLKSSPLRKSPYKPRFRDRLLTDDEIRAIWNESYDHGTFGIIVRCLILSGQRLNQIGSYDPSWTGENIVFPAWVMKSNKQHIIPLTPLLEAELRQHSRMTSFSRPMEKFRASLPDIPHFVLHDFRRFFSSTHARIGSPLHITERLMNHTTGSETPISKVYNRYTFAAEMRTAQLNYETHLQVLLGSLSKSSPLS